MAKYGIATLFEDLDVGYEFSQDNIPLHLTHVDSFQVELGADELAGLLAESLAEQSPFEIKATKDDFYGPNKDILVTEIEHNPKLSHLHFIIMKMLSDNNAVLKNPQFHNDGYSPHISAYDTRRVHPGDVLTIDNLVIASKTSDADNAMTRILTKIAL
jgi:hypothetical protein